MEIAAQVVQFGGAVGAGVILFAYAFRHVYRTVRPDDDAGSGTGTSEKPATSSDVKGLGVQVSNLTEAITALRVEIATLSGRLEQ